MADNITKMVVVPLDGSATALKTLHYIDTLFGPEHPLEPRLFYVQPSLPAILVQEARKNPETARQIKDMERRHQRMTDEVLEAGKKMLQDRGFTADRIQTVAHRKQIGVARDICAFSEDNRADAIVLSTSGRSKLEAFFMGETANKVLEASRICPVWMIKGNVASRQVLIAVDNSEPAMRAVDHAGFMLTGTDARITLFHAKRQLRRFVPKAVIDNATDLEKLWQTAAGKEIAPIMARSRDMLIKAGIPENRIDVKVVDGSRSAAGDILAAARGFGTIVMGRRGVTGVAAYTMGSVSRKVLENGSDIALWLVS